MNKSATQIGNIFDRTDCFGQTVSSFNIEGHGRVGTSIGTCFSLVILLLMVTYGAIKGKILVTRDKPLITETKLIDIRTELDELGQQVEVSFGELNYNLAFAITSKDNNKVTKQRLLHDPNYVEWYTTLKYYDEKGNKTRLNLTHHPCNNEDWANYYVPL
jgi:hypothetical protein